MAKYRKKPVVIEAVQWTGKNFEELAELIGSLEEGRPERRAVYDELDMTLKIKTLEGVMAANPGDYIIKGISGELYPCKPDIFDATYETFNAIEHRQEVQKFAGEMENQDEGNSWEERQGDHDD